MKNLVEIFKNAQTEEELKNSFAKFFNLKGEKFLWNTTEKKILFYISMILVVEEKNFEFEI